MDLGKILKAVGKTILSSVVPGGGLIVDAVNSLLPDGKKLDSTATGDDIQAAINTLPPEQQAELLERQFDVEIKGIEEWTNIVKSLAEADGVGSSTRPFIAKMMAWLIVSEIVPLTISIVYSIIDNKPEVIKAISAAWPFIAFMIGIPAGIVATYFGKRTKEKQSRYTAASGIPTTGSFISDIISAFRR